MAKDIKKLPEIVKIQNKVEEKIRLEDLKQRGSKRTKTESKEQRHLRLEDKR